MIIGKNITKRFGDLTIFDGLDFEIHDGEFVCFSGESGKGKTTLLNIQNFALIENKTVRQNLEIVRTSRDNSISIEEAVRRVGLEGKLDNKVYTLSGGEQQRIALARLILKQCWLILADEPTGSLDRKNATIVMDILKALNCEGRTVIIVTHDEDIKNQVDRRIEL